jgi:prevent-host-death family protein
MEVSVSALRAELKLWIDRARAGEEIVITDRGLPVARLTGVEAADLVQSLVRDGLLSTAQTGRQTHDAPAQTTAARGDAARAAVSGLVRRIRR